MARHKVTGSPTEQLFAEDQRHLFEKSYEERLHEVSNRPVECLGMTFPNDKARREHYLGILRERLKDPEFRKIEGFPIGADEDILALSDPPYYTACPNPFIADFIKHWNRQRKTEAIRTWLATKCVGQAIQPATIQPANNTQSAMNYPELRSFSKQDLDSVRQYQRRLPHWELQGSTYFITFRVQKSAGQPFQAAKTTTKTTGTLLASLLEEALWFDFNERYILDAYVIMPDHVHLLLKPLNDWSLAKILQGLKGYTARKLNHLLGRTGSFWQDENFDHLIRNEADWVDKFEYIHNNPVKAGLVVQPHDYQFSSLVTFIGCGRL